LAKSEREVRKHVVQWVTNIRQTPNLDPQTEEKLVAILSQLIEQKFKSLSYKELAAMLRLTPLRETESVQEVLKEERVDLLMIMIDNKFSLSDALNQALRADLSTLPMDALQMLFPQMLHINSLEQLEQWIADLQPMQRA
jgi:predicted transposase YdaD